MAVKWVMRALHVACWMVRGDAAEHRGAWKRGGVCARAGWRDVGMWPGSVATCGDVAECGDVAVCGEVAGWRGVGTWIGALPDVRIWADVATWRDGGKWGCCVGAWRDVVT